MKKFDFLIVGAGLFGGTFARLATDAGYKCLVIDKRSDIGGNLHCSEWQGIQVHTYGPHIFHTNNKEVWYFVNRFAEFNRYTNAPIANYNGELYNLPFNMNTFTKMFGVNSPKEAKYIIDSEIQEAKKTIDGEPKNLEEQALCLVGSTIYEKLIKCYTQKQWGRPCNELPADIIKRLPVRFTFDNNYFNALYQGIPVGGGYNDFIKNLFKDIPVVTEVEYNPNSDRFKDIADKIIYTGRIDEYFDYKFGKLEYRSVSWDTVIINDNNVNGVAVMNYTGDAEAYTRAIEHKFFDYPVKLDKPYSVVSYEYSQEASESAEPFYPINNDRNSKLYEKYKKESEGLENVYFGGRLGEYRYYDMDKTIESAMSLFETIFQKKTS